MKKSIVLATLGLAAGTLASYGQGTVLFNNYFNNTSPTINYAASNVPVGKANLSLGSEFSAELAWFNGTTTDSTQLSLIPSTITAFGIAPGSYPAADGDASLGAGWFVGSAVTLTPTTPNSSVVTLQIFAFNNGSWQTATIGGSSALWQVTVGGGQSPDASIGGYTPFTVHNLAVVPEPATMALGGLGLATLMLFRRKQV